MRQLAESPTARGLTDGELADLDAWCRAANYLSVGQIYRLDNPLLRRPLQREDIKPRLLGHWGTTPGSTCSGPTSTGSSASGTSTRSSSPGPGHGGPAVVGNAWLEGTYSEVYPRVGPDEAGMQRLFRQFSFPGGIPSHLAPETRDRSTRVASSATCSRTRTAPRWRSRPRPPTTT